MIVNQNKKTDKDGSYSSRVIKLFGKISVITTVVSIMKVAQQGMFTLTQMNLGAKGAE